MPQIMKYFGLKNMPKHGHNERAKKHVRYENGLTLGEVIAILKTPIGGIVRCFPKRGKPQGLFRFSIFHLS